MLVGVISDTHGNKEWLTSLIEWLNNNKVEKIIHLGDDFIDVANITEIIKIPGVYDEEYKNPEIPNRFILEFNGWKVFLSHTRKKDEHDLPTDLIPEEIIKEKKCDVVLYGHTHIPKVDREEGIIFINPGHLKAFDKKGHQATFAVINFQPQILGVKIYDFNTKLPISSKFFYK